MKLSAPKRMRAPASVRLAHSDSVQENMWKVPDTCISLAAESTRKGEWAMWIRSHLPAKVLALQALQDVEDDIVR